MFTTSVMLNNLQTMSLILDIMNHRLNRMVIVNTDCYRRIINKLNF